MTPFVLLLRGINVGGPTRSLPMKELKSMLEKLGATAIETYIQSGNVVLQTEPDLAETLPIRLSQAIHEQKGFSPAILLLTPEQLQQAIDHNPFPEALETPKLLHVGFLSETPVHPDVGSLQSLLSEGEKIQLIGSCFYHYAANGYGKSKVAEKAERLLGVPMTDRNWNTVLKLNSMLPPPNS